MHTSCGKRFHFRQRKDMCEARHSRLKCTYDGCSMTASTLQVMDKHISAVHKKLKPHICDQCGKAFNQRDQMKTHSRVHTGETPFGCEKCHKKFKFHATRNSHKCASSWCLIILRKYILRVLVNLFLSQMTNFHSGNSARISSHQLFYFYSWIYYWSWEVMKFGTTWLIMKRRFNAAFVGEYLVAPYNPTILCNTSQKITSRKKRRKILILEGPLR